MKGHLTENAIPLYGARKRPQVIPHQVLERNGTYIATLPTLVDAHRGYLFGVTEEVFDSREAAEGRVRASQEVIRVSRELQALRKTFTATYYKIEPTATGTFLVKVPCYYKSERGYLVGAATVERATWDEAKAFYLEHRRLKEQLVDHPIVDIALSDQDRIAFSTMDGFHPEITPGASMIEIPPALRGLLLTENRLNGDPSAWTYHKTRERKDWQTGMMHIVEGYVQGKGKGLLQELGIMHLDQLTPKQAIDLSTRLVIDLTKYYTREELYLPAQGETCKTTTADNKDAIQLLQEGIIRKDDPQWEGNGVCRNFASIVKAVFEALKSAQGAFTQLANTYCLYESGKEAFAPARAEMGVFRMDERIGHAWNTFVTLNETGAAHAVVADATWGRRDLQTKAVNGLDHTLLRMEPYVYQALVKTPGNPHPMPEAEYEKGIAYYLLQIETLGTSAQSSDHHLARFFVSRGVELLSRLPKTTAISEAALAVIEREYLAMDGKEIDVSEIETLWKVSERYPRLSFKKILYLYQSAGSTRYRHLFINNDLQRFAFETEPDRAHAITRLQRVPEYRIRMREVLPSLFATFDPTLGHEDAAELKYLLQREPVLERLASRAQPPFEAATVATIYAQVRALLHQENPEYYLTTVAQRKDYDLIKNFRLIRRELQLKKEG